MSLTQSDGSRSIVEASRLLARSLSHVTRFSPFRRWRYACVRQSPSHSLSRVGTHTSDNANIGYAPRVVFVYGDGARNLCV